MKWGLLLVVAWAAGCHSGAAVPAREAGHAGMAWIPAGQFRMGGPSQRANREALRQLEPGAPACHGLVTGFSDAEPGHDVYVSGFWMDVTDVTNQQFARFVEATGYVTVAERPPAGSLCFAPPSAEEGATLEDPRAWWRFVPGASWRHPEGPASSITGKEHDPVVHIAYEDAAAYANWAGKRLPTEAEWERAARGGLAGKTYVWGDELRVNGKLMANTWQGRFPVENTAEDGWPGLAPVAQFPANGFGLYDMAGNVWQWTSDWYRPDTYRRDVSATEQDVVTNPQGPASSLDPDEPDVPKRVQRGGSFLCSDQYCARYRVGTRGKGAPDTGSSHVGFRCVKNN